MPPSRGLDMADYNAMELMICVAARLLEDGSTAAVGTGAPVPTAAVDPSSSSLAATEIINSIAL